jgi:tetratricopeptide (TPR) repeat protein
VLPQIVDAGDISSFISIQARVANIQWAKGVFDEALKFYKDVLLPLSTLVGRERDTAVIYRNIADILEDQGKVDEALDLLRGKALPRAEKLGSLKDIAVFEGRIADLEEKRGNLNAALHIRRTKELKTYRYLRDTKSIAATKQKIGLALFSKGDFRGALKIYKESLVAYRRVGHQMGVAYSQCEIAAIEFKLKRVDRATARIEEAYCIFARIGRPADIARVGGVLGEFLLATGRREEARMMLTSSANANRTLGFLDEATEIEALIRQVGG